MPEYKPKLHGQPKKRIKQSMDLPMLVLVILLCCVGLVMVFSSSHADSFYRYGDSYYFVKRQIIFMGLGIIIMIAAAFFPIKIVKKFSPLFLLGSIGLLVLVLFVGKGGNASDVMRWIEIGPIQIQPSELAKLGVILCFSKWMAENQKYMKTFWRGIVPYGAVLLVIAFLMYKQPHLSGMIIIMAIGVIMMIVGGCNLKWMFGAGIAGVAGVAYVLLFTTYAKSRIDLWLNPYLDAQNKGYQTIQSLYAVGSGGFFGLGLGKSRQKYLYLPMPQNDFIFAIICEELGFVGGVLILMLFALVIWRGFMIAFKAPDRFMALVVVGIISKLAIQVFLNVAVVTNLIPNTGISLPFISAGGSAVVMQLAEMGLVLGISRYAHTAKG